MGNQDTAVLQVDFAGNFSTLWQNEVQSQHWNKKQVTLFTSVVWCQNTCKSEVVISDNLSHTKDSVISFIDKLISELVDSSVKVLQLWSNGPSSQFKNRFIATAIPWVDEKYSVKLCWNFFASSHGKGPVDGIGGAIKIIAAHKVIQWKLSIKDALPFYQAVRNESKVNIYFVSADKIREMFNKVKVYTEQCQIEIQVL